VTQRIPDPFTLVIFGASGDLARRKLVPAVYGLFRDGLLPDDFAVIGYARSEKTDESFRAELGEAIRRHARPACLDDEACRVFADKIRYVCGGYDAEGFRALRSRLESRGTRNVLFDLATPPEAFGGIVDALREAGLARRGQGAWARIIVEKPFGSDLESARALNRTIAAAFTERETFRIDHYLGKETVQNILVLRFANSIFEPLWNQKYVDHVQITVGESLGVEDRGAFYDRTGALRDILQNHMMHLLSLIAMEPPGSLDAHAVRDEKVKLLVALRPIPRPCVAQNVVRGQYAAGTLDGAAVPGYLEERGVARDSRTETFVALKCFVDNWRWEGVPFYLRTGKRLPVKVTEISVHFKPVPRVLFSADPEHPLKCNVLTIRIQPNEGISLRFEVKVPGHATQIRPYQMDFGYASAFGEEPPDAYERLLLDAALGDTTLFIRGDEVEAAWSFATAILESCKELRAKPLPQYAAGSWGPKEADDLIRADGRQWEILRRPAAPGKR
jgi:glucose-6-phosphate 1-dehydrogenase